MNWLKRVIIVAAVAFVAIQLVPVERSNPPVVSDLQAPVNVETILRRACYDCHSNETVWPWYSRVAPVSWLIADDVEEGREELNFSRWPPRDHDSDSDSDSDGVEELFEELEEVIAEEEMPPWYYVLMHDEADLDHEERTQLRAWAAQLRSTFSAD